MTLNNDIGNSNTSNYIGSGSQYIVQTPTGALYVFYIDGSSQDVYFSKSVDYGVTWSAGVSIKTGVLVYNFSIWYDRWSNINAGLIHVAFTDDTSDDVFYVSVDTENADTVSSSTVVFAGATAAVSGSCISITRTRGGNLICAGTIDTGIELFAKKSTNAGATWNDIAAVVEANNDKIILLPGFAADNQDAICIYWDADADEVSRKLYDDSADSWGETSISGSMIDVLPASTTGYPNFSAAVDLTNSQIVLVAWNAVDTLNADLLCWKITESAITAVTDVVTNSTDDQALCSISIDTSTNYWYVFYCGKSDGSETIYDKANVYYKISRDSGSTWGTETKASDHITVIAQLYSVPRFTGFLYYCLVHETLNNNPVVSVSIVDYKTSRASYALGI